MLHTDFLDKVYQREKMSIESSDKYRTLTPQGAVGNVFASHQILPDWNDTFQRRSHGSSNASDTLDFSLYKKMTPYACQKATENVCESDTSSIHWKEEAQHNVLTYDNLQSSFYEPIFPLITESVCTHSLSTPSIGSLTSEDVATIDDWPQEAETFTMTEDTKTSEHSTLKRTSGTELATRQEKKAEKSASSTLDATKLNPYSLFGPNRLTSAIEDWLKAVQCKSKTSESYPLIEAPDRF